MLEMKTAIMMWKCKSDISDLVLTDKERNGEVDKLFVLGCGNNDWYDDIFNDGVPNGDSDQGVIRMSLHGTVDFLSFASM